MKVYRKQKIAEAGALCSGFRRVVCHKAEDSLALKGEFYPFMPCIEMPSTSCFWKKKNRIRTGIIESTDMAKVAP